ncbi:MAG: glycoside hydrolase family 88 protein [Oscillospiraceae bacterium]|jgi:unsaturated chondroitin disaccharide hydrolase|nr:glycoside hydrolase family 88 protein [Oscillospiraceae bacterium]
MQHWAGDTLARMAAKFTRSAPLAARAGIIPYKSGPDGQWMGAPMEGNSWWTGGFWPALMWQLYAASGDPLFADEARRVQALLYEELLRFTGLHHDVGFMYLLSFGAEYRLTGDARALQITLRAADALAGRYNPAGFIRAWNGEGKAGWAIVDTMMNLSLLYFAAGHTGDPRYAAIAGAQAETTMRHFVRPDGSCNHIVVFDPHTGEALNAPAGQGCGVGSSWSRGQAWALYGFALCYRATGDTRYLDTAKRVAHYFIANIRPDGLTDCDFRQPDGEDRVDNIAAACAACGLLELAGHVPEAERGLYARAAHTLLRALDALCADWDEANPGVLQKCTAAYHNDNAGRHENIVYGDYFFAEAMARLCGKAIGVWYAK